MFVRLSVPSKNRMKLCSTKDEDDGSDSDDMAEIRARRAQAARTKEPKGIAILHSYGS